MAVAYSDSLPTQYVVHGRASQLFISQTAVPSWRNHIQGHRMLLSCFRKRMSAFTPALQPGHDKIWLPCMTSTPCSDFLPSPHSVPNCYVLFVRKFGVLFGPPSPFMCGRHIWKPPKPIFFFLLLLPLPFPFGLISSSNLDTTVEIVEWKRFFCTYFFLAEGRSVYANNPQSPEGVMGKRRQIGFLSSPLLLRTVCKGRKE